MADQQSSSGLDTNSVDLSFDVADYVKYLKLAVAVAVIRSRPSNMTGQQYAEQLCARYQQTQLGWKHELSRLKQQLSVVLQQQPVLDRLDERPLTGQSSTQAVARTSSSAVRQPDKGGGADAGGVLLSRHLAFLSGVLSLDSVATAASSAPTTNVVASTVELVLDAVSARLDRCRRDDDDDDDAGVVSHSAAGRAVETVARVADVPDAAVATACCDAVRRFARNLVTGVMRSQLLNQSRRQRAACDYLQSLSTSQSLQPIVIGVLLDAVADVADRLRRAADDDDDDETTAAAATGFPATAAQLENVAYVLECLERVLGAGVGGGLPSELRRRLSSQLDQSLSHVASAFPLFAYGVWQLGGIVDRVQLSDVDEI